MVSPGSISFPALGTTAAVVTSDVADLLAAAAVARTEIDAIDRACSRFRSDSELMRLHASPDRWTRVGPVLFEAVEVALGAARATGGVVDPTVGEAVVRAGYDRDFAQVSPTGPSIEATPAPGWRVVGMDAERSAIRLPTGVLLDLGATAKALAADRAAANAVEATGGGVLVSLGGDLAAFGPPPAGGWTVSIADDHAEASEGEVVGIAGGGLATSSTTVRRWVRGGVPVHHVIDPRTGGPAAEVWRTVSVTAARCVDANTATTAALVLGEGAVPWLRSLGLPARLVRPDGRTSRLGGWPEARAA
ncbi:MAG: FAD:protein FMN transferase [Actinomycetota bacterium]